MLPWNGRADRVCALVSARPLLIMAQGQAPAAGTAMASPSKLRWFGFGGNRMDDEDEGMSQKVSIQRTEAAVASVSLRPFRYSTNSDFAAQLTGRVALCHTYAGEQLDAQLLRRSHARAAPLHQ